MPANLENSAVATGLEKLSFHSHPKESNAKECSNYHTIALISHASKVMLKILQARLQQYMNCELPDVQTGFRKGRGTRDQIANILQFSCSVVSDSWFWRRKWQPTPVFLPGESQGRGNLVGCGLWGHTELDTTEVTQQQQQPLSKKGS